MYIRFILAAALVVLSATLAVAEAYRCNFSRGTTTTLKGRSITSEANRGQMTLDYLNIDRQKGVGQMVGNQSVVPIVVISGSDAITLIEIVSSGVVQVATIYQMIKLKYATYRGVYARHTSLGALAGGEAVPSQWFGECKRLE